MASAFSQQQNFGTYIGQLPLDTIASGLSYKQNKYDVNRAKLQSFITNFSNIDLAKKEDQEHFYNNLTFLKTQVEKFGAGDLSIDGVSEQLAQYISYAADDKVAKGVAGTRVYRKIQSEAENIRENNPEQYSDVNLQYSLSGDPKGGINAWLNDGEAGTAWTQYGNNTSYIPFTDVIGKANEIVKSIEPTAFATLTPAGDFTFRTQSGEKLSEDRIKSALELQLFSDPTVLQQVKINAWGKFRSVDDNEFANTVRDNYRTIIDDADAKITKLESKKFATNDSDKKAQIQQNIDYLTTKRKKFSDLVALTPDQFLNNIVANRESIETQLYGNDLVDNIVATHAFRSIKKHSFVTDQAALTVWKEQMADRRHKENLAQKERLSAATSIIDAIADGDAAKANRLRTLYGYDIDDFRDFSPSKIEIELNRREKADALSNILTEELTNQQSTVNLLAQNFLDEAYTPDKVEMIKENFVNQKLSEGVDPSEAQWNPSEYLLSIGGMFKEDADISENTDIREGAVPSSLRRMYSNFQEQVDDLETVQCIKETVDTRIDDRIDEVFNTYFDENNLDETLSNLENSELNTSGVVATRTNEIGLSSDLFTGGSKRRRLSVINTPDGYELLETRIIGSNIHSTSTETSLGKFKTVDALKDKLKTFVLPEERERIYAEEYTKIYGDKISGLGFDVTLDRIDHVELFADLVSQAQGTQTIPEEFNAYNSTETIIGSIENINKSSKDLNRFQGGFVELDPSGKVTVTLGKDDKDKKNETFEVNITELNPESLAYKTLLSRFRDIQLEVGLREKENAIFRSMELSDQAQSLEPFDLYIDFKEELEDGSIVSGHFHIDGQHEFRITTLAGQDSSRSVTPRFTVHKYLDSGDGKEVKQGSLPVGNLYQHASPEVARINASLPTNDYFKSKLVTDEFLKDISAETLIKLDYK